MSMTVSEPFIVSKDFNNDYKLVQMGNARKMFRLFKSLIEYQKINAMLLRAGQRLDSSTEAPRALRPVVRKGVNPVRCG